MRHKFFLALTIVIIMFGVGWVVFYSIKWYDIKLIADKEQAMGHAAWGEVSKMYDCLAYIWVGVVIIASSKLFAFLSSK